MNAITKPRITRRPDPEDADDVAGRSPISGTSDDDRKQICDEIKLHLGIVLDLAMDLQNEFPHSATAKAGRDIEGNLKDLIKDFVDGDLSELVRRAKEVV